MAKHYENETHWSPTEQTLIGMMAMLGDLWNPSMSDQQIEEAYHLAMNPPDQNPAKIGGV